MVKFMRTSCSLTLKRSLSTNVLSKVLHLNWTPRNTKNRAGVRGRAHVAATVAPLLELDWADGSQLML